MSPWRWSPERTEGIWRHGAKWLRPFVVLAPWLTVACLYLMLHLVSGTLTIEKGVLFDLPDGDLAEGKSTELVALIMPTDRETLVFFDDSRYLMGDATSVSTLARHLSDRVLRAREKTLLVLADRRVTSGNLIKLAAIARRGGVKRILFAEKHREKVE